MRKLFTMKFNSLVIVRVRNAIVSVASQPLCSVWSIMSIRKPVDGLPDPTGSLSWQLVPEQVWKPSPFIHMCHHSVSISH